MEKMTQAYAICQTYCTDARVTQFIEEHLGTARGQSLSSNKGQKLATGVIAGIIEETKSEPYLKITAKEVILDNYKLTFHQEPSEQKFFSPHKIALMDAFLSTPRFIKSLTDISMNLSFL